MRYQDVLHHLSQNSWSSSVIIFVKSTPSPPRQILSTFHGVKTTDVVFLIMKWKGVTGELLMTSDLSQWIRIDLQLEQSLQAAIRPRSRLGWVDWSNANGLEIGKHLQMASCSPWHTTSAFWNVWQSDGKRVLAHQHRPSSVEAQWPITARFDRVRWDVGGIKWN